MSEEVNQIVINKEKSFTENWHEGYVESKGERHYFWLIDPQGVDPRGNEYTTTTQSYRCRNTLRIWQGYSLDRLWSRC